MISIRTLLHNMIKTKSIKRKIILTISYIAVVVPTFLVGLLVTIYYYLGIEKIFSEKITDSINDTVKVATLYLNEHNNNIKTSALIAANETAWHLYNLMYHPPKLFTHFLDQKARALGLSDIVVFTDDKKIIGATSFTFSMMFENIDQETIDSADEGLIMVRTSATDKVQALLRMDKFITNMFIGKVYILVGRYVDSKILKHLETTQEQADVFLNVKTSIENVRRKVISAFLMLSVVFLFICILISRKLADFILQPINDLSAAIKNFKLGKKIVKVNETMSDDEMNVLTRSFNKMIETITSQHANLLNAKQLIEERNQFIEVMMSELSAGVIVLNHKFKVEMSNLSALTILGIDADQTIIGKDYHEVLPEFVETINSAIGKDTIVSENISIVRASKSINLLLKAQVLKTYGFHSNFNKLEKHDKIIITLDDITIVVSGQRFKAWADIARRLAHEIKNPLTPIQLAVDRLEQKFLKHIKTDADLFQKYIHIINNRVEDIKKMLTEFVEFAGISTLNMKPHEILKIINDVIFLQKHQWSDIEYELDSNIDNCKVLCEKTYITQVMTNLLKNSAESIAAASAKSEGSYKGRIKIILRKSKSNDEVVISVEDNGTGISSDLIERICEPYVTTKATGTGLGLSIVKKIIEEHKSDFRITNGADGGSVASFALKIAKK